TGNPDPRKDFYFWHALTSAAEVTIPVALPSLATPSAVALRVFVHGATDHPEQAHQVELRWNGQSLGTFDLFGRTSHVLEVPLDGVAATADNELVIAQHVLGEALPVVYVDTVEVDYVREARAEGMSFEFGASVDGVHTVTGFTEDNVLLYDISDADSPVAYGETPLIADGETYRLSFTGADAATRFLAAGPGAVRSPIEVRPHFASTLREANHDEDYIIVAASHLVEAAKGLAELREADGYRVLLVDIEDVYWAFAGGVSDPAAVRSFLAHAWETWASPPRFAALVGLGTFDYRDLGGLGGNWVPPMYAQTDGGLFASDSMLGDVVGDDGVPEIAVGRLPVTNGDELAQVLEATRRFEADHADMDVLVASDDSEMREFAHATRLLRTSLPFERIHEIDLDQETLQEARARLFALWEDSLSWVSFIGHGGLDRLANEGLLTTTDVPTLSANSSPVILGWTCNIARFDIPGFLALGHDLIVRGISPAVFSATGWSNHHDTDALRTELTAAAFASDAETIGEAVLRGHRAASEAPVQLHRVYALLGDPALRLRAPKADRDLNDPSASGEPVAGQGDEASWGSSGCQIGPERGADPWFGLLVLVAGLWVSSRRRQSRAALS
ncbi:MAG: C25 family cysteine peptidase, partial [Myxococcales bacterium]|nr:C25 family cysteine peptidase [Myxococcales bacterium]